MVQQLNRIFDNGGRMLAACRGSPLACTGSARCSAASVWQRRTHTLYCLFGFEMVGSQKKR
jgi:hypothetical protein